MYNTFSVSFYCRKCKENSKGLAPVEVRVSFNGEQILTSLPKKANASDFKKQMTCRQQTPLKAYTSAVAAKIEDLQLKLMLEGKPFTREALRTYIYYGFTEQHYKVSDIVEGFLKSQRKKVDAGLSTFKNYRKYEIVRDLFYHHSNVDENSSATAIRHNTIIDFNTYLLSVYDSTTVAGMMQKLKSMILYALKNKMITENPFLGFKISRKEKDVEFLTQEEVSRIRNAEMPTHRLEMMRDLFLFQCFSAISYCDMMKLVPEDFKKNEFGHVYITKQRSKTGVKYCAILFDDAMTIAEKYSYKLPNIVLQNYNNGLKVIGDICRINKPLHSHIGRHTAACYLLNEKGLSIEIVAMILGHNSTKITRHYAKLMDKSVFEAVSKASSEQDVKNL